MKTSQLKRLVEVLSALHISYDEQPSHIVLLEEKLIVFPSELLVTSQQDFDEDTIFLTLNGELITSKNKKCHIKYCVICENYYIAVGQKKTEHCPYCGCEKIYNFTTKGRIPNWGIHENIINPLVNLGAQTSKQKEQLVVIQKLASPPKVVSVTEQQILEIKQLKVIYPNFSEVIDYVLSACQLCFFKQTQELTLRPFLLVGPPGCGKTSFLANLCKILQGKAPVTIDLGNGIPDFAITGSDYGFKNSHYGIIIEAILSDADDRPTVNPFIHFDELDKINHNDNSCQNVFFSILEQASSRCFRDNYLGVEIDASHVNYVFSANSLETLSKPLINRLKVFHIPNYTNEQLKNVLDNYYENWLDNNNMKREFLPCKLSEEIKERIIHLSHGDTRAIRDALMTVFEETLHYDDANKIKIALFSSEELYLGWEKFKGTPLIKNSKWIYPFDFKEKIQYEMEKNAFADLF